MEYFKRVRFACFLGLISATPSIFAAAQDASNVDKGYVCAPDALGQGWDCSEDHGQKPVVNWGEILPRATEQSAPGREDAPVQSAMQTDPQTGLSADPEDWFTPTPPRPVDAEHRLDEDLAKSVYVAGTGDAAGGGTCPGGYQTRIYPYGVDADAEAYPITAQADQMATQLDESALLDGNVTIEQGNRRITADSAQLTYESRVARFPDGVRLDQPGLLMQGQNATIHLNTKEVALEDAQFVLIEPNIRGRAERLDQTANGDLRLTQGAFTRCEPGNNGWSLGNSALVIEEDEVFGTARNAVLKLKSVPVFYSPYLKFPVSDERVSGFLFPNMGYSDEDGVDLSVPYYLNLAPNYDATIIPRYIGDRGAGMELELRHKASWQDTVLSGAILPKDDLYNGYVDREDYDEQNGQAIWGDFDPADRWLGAIEHQGRLGPVSTFVDFTRVSDRDYFRDLGTQLSLSSRRELERRGGFQFNRGGLFARLWAQGFQRLDEVEIEEYQRLPELEVTYRRNLVGPLSVNVESAWSAFDRDTEGLNGLSAVTGNRFHLEPRLRLDVSRAWGYLNVTGGYRYTTYDLEQDADARGFQLTDDRPDRGIGVASADGSLVFERDLNWFGQQLLQTLEPRVYYLWQAYEDQSQLPRFDASSLTFGYSQLFRDNRFSGLDRIGDANQVSLGVTTRFLSRANGREYFRFSIGEIFYFDDREVTLNGRQDNDDLQNNSAIATEMSASLAGNWRVFGNMVWDPDENEVEEGAAGVQYRRDNGHIFNIGFRNRRDSDVEETDFSLYWPISKHFSIMGRWNYDLISGRTIEGIGGLEYSDCCLKVRVMARRFLDSPTAGNFEEIEADDGIFLQIVFKGLAGFGTKVESVLERGIRGYRTPQQRDYFGSRD